MRRNKAIKRGGATTVEMSLVLPILLAMFFGSIECSRAITIKETIRFAAYKGARVGAMPGANRDSVMAKVEAELNKLGVIGGQVELQPAVITAQTDEVTVMVSVPLGKNLVTGDNWITNWNMTASCTLKTEKISLQ